MEDRRYASLPPQKTEAAELEVLAADLERQFRGALRLFAARRLGTPLEAEDVAQETLRITIEAFRGGRIATADALPAFLFQTARNLCMHHTRSAAREGKALRTLAAGSSEPVEHPLSKLIREERKRDVQLALNRMEESDRELLRMSYGDELTAEEIGSRLGLTAVNVRVRRHRAIRRLAELLGVTTTHNREQKD